MLAVVRKRPTAAMIFPVVEIDSSIKKSMVVFILPSAPRLYTTVAEMEKKNTAFAYLTLSVMGATNISEF